MWSPYTGLLGDSDKDKDKDGENEKEEKRKGVEAEKEGEGEGEGHGDDAVALEGDLKNGNTEGIEFILKTSSYIRCYLISLHCTALHINVITFAYLLLTFSSTPSNSDMIKMMEQA